MLKFWLLFLEVQTAPRNPKPDFHENRYMLSYRPLTTAIRYRGLIYGEEFGAVFYTSPPCVTVDIFLCLISTSSFHTKPRIEISSNPMLTSCS